MPYASGGSEVSSGGFLLALALAIVLMFHGGLLPFTHDNTYDAFVHMFFGDSYNRSWFDPWEPRWYTGFATTSYPPGTHMAIGALQNFIPLRAAFIIVQIVGLFILTIGVYRFSLIWVGPRASGYAAISLALASSISETIHIFGQLPTICSLGFFLNALPHVFNWLTKGRWRDLLAGLIYAMATTAAHHVTTLFGMVLFIGPIALHSLRIAYIQNADLPLIKRIRALGPTLVRGMILMPCLVVILAGVVFPYWYWSLTDPITQVPIPHGSRENFIERLDLGFIFFLLPWGVTLVALPYLLYKAFASRLWPLGLAITLCFILGTGGTTPIPRMMLGGAFDILTLDRFTFWGSILVLPILGFGLERLIHGTLGQTISQHFGKPLHRALITAYFTAVLLVALFAAVLPTIRPTQPDPIAYEPIKNFMEQDQHDRWRYLTLGFGDQFAFISAQTAALSVDGNYHSARRLPNLTSYAVERLENAKYLGVPGLGSLQQFLVNSEAYHLKYVFSNDAFYAPLLYFTGWTQLSRLSNGVAVWEKPDISPLPAILPRAAMSEAQNLMWGLIPPTSLILALLLLIFQAARGRLLHAIDTSPTGQPQMLDPSNLRLVVIGFAWIGAVIFAILFFLSLWLWSSRIDQRSPERVVEDYFVDLDFRRWGAAHARLDPETQPNFDDFLFQRLWEGGLINSFGKLTGIDMRRIEETERTIDWEVDLQWLTSLGNYDQIVRLRTILREDAQWYVVHELLSPQQSPNRISKDPGVRIHLTGRRQPRSGADVYRDRLDRTQVAIHAMRLVKSKGRYHLIGGVHNDDADPMFITLEGVLRGADDAALAKANLGQYGAHRLLPAEGAGVRIDFEGVLSLQDAKADESFDPELFVPLVLEGEPVKATIEARAVAHAHDFYRGVGLADLVFNLQDNGETEVSGIATNLGTEICSILRLTFTLYDMDGLPLWVAARYLEANIIPGQQQAFTFRLPRQNDFEVISEILQPGIAINGSAALRKNVGSDFKPSNIIPLDPRSGFSGVHIHLSSLTYDPLF